MRSVVYTQIERCPQSLLSAIADYSVADLHEALGAIEGRIRLMSPRMRPIAPGQRAVGQAITSYNYPGDNLMIHAALNIARRGDMLVLVNGGVPQGALWGDVAGTFATEKGIAGVVADGPVRDTGALREMGCKVWSTIISPAHPEKRGPGAVNIPVVCDGVRIEPGDIIVADDDGVLSIPIRLAAETVEKARSRAESEVAIRAQLKTGASLFEILQMQNNLDAAGVQVVDATWRDETGS
ncbi:4-carboxy-4-hydroxy-2-oxoadipate aldolase/oxaloacetate decarboxylase [Rhodoligotrophos defluvii]|uniref:4-carboxy-4-hydroxy-2-oxoadipate aldolase/oxaloacetate decarboxylase n=1 Tax=Rhodoligotrophos defluvii TaxID=2561934 RepID=UPI0010C9DFAE|nr:4-carboxy-4-hydroxy-2-oxoadipate aldolase/oxaloacetate decarboxylase [Rhodoligotrophos defluvii]